MKKLLTILGLFITAYVSAQQPIVNRPTYDSTVFRRPPGGNHEFVLQNSTSDIPGVLTNIGGGVTAFVELNPISYSGNYTDLTGVPTALSQFSNDLGFIDNAALSTALAGKQNAFSSGTGFIKINGTSISYDNSTYLTTSSAASTYLTQANASSTYLTQANATSTYLTQANAASTYLTSATAATTYLTQANASSTYLTQANAATTYQPLDADLTTFSGLAPPDNDILQRKSGGWINRTPAQFKADLALSSSDVGLGNVPNIDATNATNISSGTIADARLSANVPIMSSGVLTATNFIGNYTSASTTTSANFAVVSSNNAATTSNAAFQWNGSTQMKGRMWTGVTASATLATNDNYATYMLTSQGYTEGGAGTSKGVAQLVVQGLTGTNGAGATQDAATVWITGALTGVTPTGRNDGFRVDANSYLNGNVEITGTITNSALTTALAGKVGTTDTATMLSPYATDADVALKLSISDTTALVAPYARLSSPQFTNQIGIGTASTTSARINLPSGSTVADGILFGTVQLYKDGSGRLATNAAFIPGSITNSTYSSAAGSATGTLTLGGTHGFTIARNTADAGAGAYINQASSGAAATGNILTGAFNSVTKFSFDKDGILNAAGVSTGTVSTTEFDYLDGVTSAIQTQINNKVTANGAITGATKTKITYDSKGLVTAGADATTTDIAEGSNLYYTDERAQDALASAFAAGTHSGITVTYNDASNKFDLTVTGGGGMTNPMTTLGDIIYGGASGTATRLGAAAGFLKSDGTNAPAWTSVTKSDVGLSSVENTALSTWAGSTNITTLGTITTGTVPVARIGSLGTGVGTWLGTPSSANLASAITDETGSGALVFATSPAFTTPNLGTPSAATLTNATGLPISTGVSGLGTGVATYLATPTSANFATMLSDETGTGAVVLATSPVLITPNLGTPSAVTLTNATGLPISTGVSGLGTNVATFLATPSSSNLADAVTGETGSGALVFGTAPTFGGLVTITNTSASANQVHLLTNGISTASSGITTEIAIAPTFNETGTAGNNALFISPYYQSTGSGAEMLIRAGTNTANGAAGTHTDKFTVDNTGAVVAAGNITGADGAFSNINISGTITNSALTSALDSKVDENGAITGATKTKITYDAKGLVTAGANAAVADISGLQDSLNTKAYAARNITIYGASTATQDLSADRTFYPQDWEQQAMNALGTSIKATTVGVPLPTGVASMTSGTVYYAAVWVPYGFSSTGVKWWQGTAFVGTAGSNTNGIALFSYSAGTLTKVAETASSATFWQGTANALQSTTWSGGAVDVSPGLYFLAFLYTSSAQTTAPQFGQGLALTASAVGALDYTNSAKMFSTQTGQTAHAATTKAMTALFQTTTRAWGGLY